MALPATGSSISMSTVRNYFGLSGAVSLYTLGTFISPQVTTNIKLSATFGGWQNPNKWGTATGVDPTLDEGPGAVYPAPSGGAV
jgi:hypothetical protein